MDNAADIAGLAITKAAATGASLRIAALNDLAATATAVSLDRAEKTGAVTKVAAVVTKVVAAIKVVAVVAVIKAVAAAVIRAEENHVPAKASDLSEETNF